MKKKAVPTPTHLPVTGNCYQDSWELLDSLRYARHVRLVHGRPVLQRPPYVQYGHAWVELNGLWCSGSGPLAGQWVSREVFYDAGQIDPALCVSYTWEQAQQFLLSHRHYGPWEGVDAQPPVEDDE